MLNKIGIVLPVRDGGTGRSERLKRCIESWLGHSEGLSHAFIIVDSDEVEKYSFVDNYDPEFVTKVVAPHGITLMQKINYWAIEIAEQYKYVAFIGDDIVFRDRWEKEFIDFLSQHKYALAYANDLHQGGKLATHPCITSNMIKAVGFFGCPAVQHNCFDNYWMNIVHNLGEIKYFPSIIMDHMHPHAGKANHDNISHHINNLLYQDVSNFDKYMNENKESDIKKILEYEDDVL